MKSKNRDFLTTISFLSLTCLMLGGCAENIPNMHCQISDDCIDGFNCRSIKGGGTECRSEEEIKVSTPWWAPVISEAEKEKNRIDMINKRNTEDNRMLDMAIKAAADVMMEFGYGFPHKK